MSQFFELVKTSKDSKARAGVLNLNGTKVLTPVFIPVGTLGNVKAMLHRSIIELGYNLILGNTYHLYLRPGMEVLSHFGGLHKFISWEKGILTDSGGFQIFSLKDLRKISEGGVEFRSHIDGSKHFFSPESVIDFQRIFGSNIMMVLDECTPFPCDYFTARRSMELSLHWAERSRQRFDSTGPLWGHTQFMFGIVQGSTFPELRTEYIDRLQEIGFDGYAIGGLAVGEPTEAMYEITDICTEKLPKDKPRYLMGVGTPENLLDSIERGIDMFDCVLPTRNARNGQIFTTRGKINIRNAKYKFSKEPIDENLENYVSRNFSLGYLRHLFVAKELLAYELATYQNLAFYMWLMDTARKKILSDEFRQWKNNLILNFKKCLK